MAYWDTSALVKLYVQEQDSAVFDAKASTPAAGVVTSRIALYESHATFRRKEVEGSLQSGAAQKLYSELIQNIAAGQLTLVEMAPDVEAEYGQVLITLYQQNPSIRLRTLDALHLASARVAAQTELVVTDKRMREAAKALGFSLFPS